MGRSVLNSSVRDRATLPGPRVQTMDMLIVLVTLTIGCWTAESCWTSSPPTDESSTDEITSDDPQRANKELFLPLSLYPICDDDKPDIFNSTFEDFVKWVDGE